MSKRQISILLILVAVVVGGVAFAIITRAPAPSAKPTPPSTETPAGEIPTGATGEAVPPEGVSTTSTTPAEIPTPAVTPGVRYTLKKLSDGPAVGYWASKSSSDVFYLTNEGHVVSAKEGPDVELSQQEVAGVMQLEGSPTGRKALVEFGSPTSPQWAIFDSQDKAWRPLPAEVREATWNSADDKLIATVKTPNATVALVRISLSKTPFENTIIKKDFRFNGISLSSKSTDELYIMEQPTKFALSRVWLFNLKTGALTLVLSPANGLILNQSSDHDIYFRFFSPNNFAILNRTFGLTQPFNHVTLPQKCDGNTVVAYCFVPKDEATFNPDNPQPDSYLMKKTFTSDDLYRFDLITGDDARVIEGQSVDIPALDAYGVITHNTTTFFINRYDHYLYAVERSQ